MSKEDIIPTIDPRIAMGIDEEWMAMYRKMLGVDTTALKGGMKKRMDELEKRGTKARAEILSNGFLLEEEVRALLGEDFDPTLLPNAVSVRDHGDVLYAKFQFTNGVDGLRRVAAINKASEHKFPSWATSSNWMSIRLDMFNGQPLSVAALTMNDPEFKRFIRFCRVDARARRQEM